MILPLSQDIYHRSEIYRLLIEVADNSFLSRSLIFKGGTCAALLGYLDRFSVDLDFDLNKEVNIALIRKELEKIFDKLNLEIKGHSIKTIQFTLRYQAKTNLRNTLKIEAVDRLGHYDKFVPSYLSEIDRYLVCQTRETMFSHKLVALLDRYKRHGFVAGRDIYDIHYFFLESYKYDNRIIEARTGLTAQTYLIRLRKFIKEKVNQTIIDEDLNMLLSKEKYQLIRKYLKQEVLNMLDREIERFERKN